jgi:hypothetical protein
MHQAANITAMGEAAWMVEAIPPGRRYAARKIIGKKNPMLQIPSTADFHHQEPRGSRRVPANSRRPAGSARMTEENSGRSAGRNRSVTAYVVPHAIGATLVYIATRHIAAFLSLDGSGRHERGRRELGLDCRSV